ncbi:MAG: 30S ribosomal protein S1 [Gammaproteobacteria bacterium]
MSQSFAQLFEASKQAAIKPGTVVQALVISVQPEYVVVDAGLKSAVFISSAQFKNEQGEVEVAVGDSIDVTLEALEDGYGETKLSRDKAKKVEAWKRLMVAHEANESVMGLISSRVKGGFTVEVDGIRAFLPGSLLDGRMNAKDANLEGKEMEFKVIKIDQKRNNVVVSRRAFGGEGDGASKETMSSFQEGQEVKGIIKNLTDYGAFVDLGGVDGLLHITDMAWRRVKHPSEIVTVGQELMVKILKFDRDRTRVSLGLKQLGNDPWLDIKDRYPEGSKLTGKITNIADYGCFVEIEDGVEGLVHVSEMDWTNKNIHPSKVVQLNEEVEVKVLDIDEERRRISLGIKQCRKNPWESFASTYKKGDKVEGKIKSITDFGVFIGLEGNIDGLIHLSDLSWNDEGEEALRQYKKGQSIEAIVLAIDPDRERISLGIKQLEGDPFSTYTSIHTKGSLVTGTVTAVDAKGANINLAEGVDGYLKVSELSRDKIEDARTVLKEGDSIEVKVINVDRKNRSIALSIKARETQEEQEALRELNKGGETATLGDLFKKKMDA